MLLAALLGLLPATLGCARPAGEGGDVRPPPAPEERPASTEAVAAGRALFARHCAACHGERGDGAGPRATHLAGAPADLRALPEERRDPRHLFQVLREGVPGSDMPSWRGLEDEELWQLVAFLRTLAPGAEERPREGAP